MSFGLLKPSRRRIAFLFLLLCLTFLLIRPRSAAGQEAVRVLKDQAIVDYPDGVMFRLTAGSDSTIERVDLLYGTSGRSCQPGTARQSLDFNPDSQVSVEWTWEWKRSGSLPPGSEIWWQWEITDEARNTLRTPKETLTLEDQRYRWQKIQRDDILLRWFQGSRTFGEDLHAIAWQSRERLSRELGIPPEGLIQITVYPTAEELQETLIYAPEWTGGMALPNYNSFLIAVAPEETNWAKTIIPHEMAHLVVGSLFYNCRGAVLPTWLSEGLAEYSESPVSPMERSYVLDALEDERVSPLQSLASGFSGYGEDANLAYIQSGMVIEYLYQHFGADRMLELLEVLKSGDPIDSSLTSVYGFDTYGLDAAWRDSLGFTFPKTGIADPSGRTPTPSLIPTLPPMNIELEPTSTATQPPPTPTPKSTATSLPVPESTGALPTATPAPSEPASAVEEASAFPLEVLWIAGGVTLVLLALFLFTRLFRR